MAKKPTHYTANHVVGPFARGSIITAEELDASIGVKDRASDEEAAKVREAGVKRLVDLGAISPTPAPDDAEPDADAPKPTPSPSPSPAPKPEHERPTPPAPPAPPRK